IGFLIRRRSTCPAITLGRGGTSWQAQPSARLPPQKSPRDWHQKRELKRREAACNIGRLAEPAKRSRSSELVVFTLESPTRRKPSALCALHSTTASTFSTTVGITTKVRARFAWERRCATDIGRKHS